MKKRPDNMLLFAVMTAGVYFMYETAGNPLMLFLLLPLPLIFIFAPASRIFISVFITGSLICLIRSYAAFINPDGSGIAGGSKMTVSGRVSAVSGGGMNAQVSIDADSVSISGKNFSRGGRFVSYIAASDICTGDFISVKGKFVRFGYPSNHFERNMRRHAFINGLEGEISGAAIVSHKKKDGFYRYIKRSGDFVKEIFDRRLSFRAGGFMSAVMLGRRDGLERPVVKDFADSGTIHLLAVSGLHVGFLIMMLGLINSLTGLRKIPLIIANSAVLLCYAALTGAGPSVIRAVLMAIILMISHPLKRKMKFIDIIGTAGMLSVIYDPAQIFNPGFVLSFGAVASIAIIYTRLIELSAGLIKTENRTLKKLYESVVLSLSVTIGLMPFALFIFGRYNLLSILTNVVLIPLAAFIFTAGILLIALDSINIIAEFLSDIIRLLHYLISETAELTAHIEIFTVNFKADIFTAAVLCGAVVSIFYIRNYKIKLSLSLTMAVVLAFNIYLTDTDPEIYFFNTSSDDAFVFHGCGVGIISAGDLSRREISGIIKPYLLQNNIHQIDYLVWRGKWTDAEKAVGDLEIPVRNLVLEEQEYIPYGEYNVYDLSSIGGKISLPGGHIIFSGRKNFFIKSGTKEIFFETDGERISGESVKLHYPKPVRRSFIKKSSGVF
jgi:ComEC/Rec2-related protein